MPEPTPQLLDARLEKLEKESSSVRRFFVQYLLAPILVLVMGAYFNAELEKQKTQVAQFQLAQQVLPALFSENPFVGFAAHRLITRAVSDAILTREIECIVTDYYLNRLQQFVDAGDTESAATIVRAARAVDVAFGNQFVALVQQDAGRAAAVTSYEKALSEERRGFTALLDCRYDDAITAFKAAEEVYSGFHQVYEIADLLTKNRERLADPAIRREVLQTVVTRMSWRAPSDLLERISVAIRADVTSG